MTPQLGDRWLPVVRIIWLLTAAAVLLLLIPELQATFASAQRLCVHSNCNGFQLDAQAKRTLQGIGISPPTYAAYGIVLALTYVLVSFTVAATLMWRRSRDLMVLVTAFTALLSCNSGSLPLQAATGLWSGPTRVLTDLALVAVALFFFLFPTGRFVPRWTVFLAMAYVALGVIPSSALQNGPLSSVGFLLLIISVIGVQIYRFRRVSNLEQRQQTKVVLLGLSAFAATFVVATFVYIVDGNIEKQAIPLILDSTAFAFGTVFIPLSVGFAVLRYRLWDVDVLINRTLVYVALTASLAVLYLGSVVAFQAVSRAVTGQQSGLAVAVSTLVIAALFNPLRHRFQDLIARAFFRRKYDAAKVLASFGATCRDETDLSRLQVRLERVVEETMQPRHVSLWLTEAGRSGPS